MGRVLLGSINEILKHKIQEGNFSEVIAVSDIKTYHPKETPKFFAC